MDRETLVYVDLDSVTHLMGRLWARARNNKESATFEYDAGWLQHPARFSLEPALQLGPGPFHTSANTPMFGAIGDSAPDRWGRALMRRMERRRAEREGTAPRPLQEIDYLLLVDDEARQGALRFAERQGGPFLRPEGVKRIPPLVELPELLSAAERVMEDKDTEEDLRLLFAPGSSLGGARPKASVIEKDCQLAIAKFPRKDDEINTVVWEYAGQEGWRLSPAYDLNPVPTDIKPRILATAINEDDSTASLKLAMDVAGYFDLDYGKARAIASEVGKAVSKWRDEAALHGLAKAAIDRLASAFEHDDLKMACAGP